MAPPNSKTVLITGCSEGGIGYSLASTFQKRGLHVFATVRKLSKLGALAEKPNVTPLELDINSAESIAAAVSVVSAQTNGKLDFLINNAGVSVVGPALDMPLQAGRDMFETNFWAPLAMIQAFAPLIIASHGTIVNQGSLTTNINTPYMSVYSASKSALTTLGVILRMEMAPLGVTVLTLVTGGVKTKIMDSCQIPELGDDSYFKPVEANVRNLAGNQGPQPTPADEYAENVVGDLLAGRHSRYGCIYRGYASSLSRYLPTVMPVWYHVSSPSSFRLVQS
jgi:1-acylglycerone phosphate reductase